MPGDEELQDHEEDVFLDGLPPLSSNSSEASTIASTPRARFGLRGDRIGEADHLGPQTEDECDGRTAWLQALTKSTTLGDSVPCRVFFCSVAGRTADGKGKTIIDVKDRKRLDALVSRAF